jgi:enamine deaminase RidA (YjgF/YER057c/UK114 family)
MTLRGAGGDLRNVTQVQIFLADGGDMAVVNQVWTSYFSEPYPNRATVVVKSLIDPKARIEITAQAYLGSD